MSDNNPIPLSQDEWSEILELETVRRELGLMDESVSEIIDSLYGVKFNNKSYASTGEVFIIHIDNYTEKEPLVLAKDDKTKELKLITY